jgi:hypothetical protein
MIYHIRLVHGLRDNTPDIVAIIIDSELAKV